MTDDELDRMLYAVADRARTPIDAKPDAAALAMLERIMATDPHPHRTRNRVLGWASGAAAAVVAAVIGVTALAPTAAMAGNPAPLVFEGESTVSETVHDAQTTLAAVAGPVAPERFTRTATWSFNLNADDATATVVPQLVTLQWEADQSGRITVVDGVAYDPSDAAANTSSEIVVSGEVSMDMIMKPGEYATAIAEEPGESREDMLATLVALGTSANPSASETVDVLGVLFSQWTLTNAQESALLEILAEQDGVTALGETTDRLGRPVSGLRVVTADGEASETILISTDTGRIVGMERTVLHDSDLLQAGSIIGYQLFDVLPDEIDG